jgi:hypothetical protein
MNVHLASSSNQFDHIFVVKALLPDLDFLGERLFTIGSEVFENLDGSLEVRVGVNAKVGSSVSTSS